MNRSLHDPDPADHCDHVGVWAGQLGAWVPDVIFDAHVHLGPAEVMGPISAARRRVPLCTFTHLTWPTLGQWYGRLFPGKRISGLIAFPFPLQEVDIAGANRYVIDLMRQTPQVRGFLLAHPTDAGASLAAWDEALAAGVRFSGVKPYFDLLGKGVLECSIPDFIPRRLLEFMDGNGLVLMLHTSGIGMGDPANQQYVRTALDRFPNIKIVLAHFGRYFEPQQFFTFCQSDLLEHPRLYLEMSSVTVPEVYAAVLRRPSLRARLLFGTDLPFGLITGMEAWSERAGAIFVTRDRYPWTDAATQEASPVRPESLTYNTYHVIHAFKTALESLGLPPAEEDGLKQAVFRKNAESLWADR